MCWLLYFVSWWYRDSTCSVVSDQTDQFSPAGHKRRSSSLIVDTPGGGLERLSLSGSFLDSTINSEQADGASPSTPVGVTTPAPLAAPPTPRQMVFLELLQTETNYVEILHTIMTVSFKLR